MSRTAMMRAKLAAQAGLPALAALGAAALGAPAQAYGSAGTTFWEITGSHAWKTCVGEATNYHLACYEGENGTVLQAKFTSGGYHSGGPETAVHLPLPDGERVSRVMNGLNGKIAVGFGDPADAPANAATGNETIIGPGGIASIYEPSSRGLSRDEDSDGYTYAE